MSEPVSRTPGRAERRAAPKPARVPLGDRTTYPAGEGPTFTLHRGTRPLLVSLPHVGTLIPDDIRARLRPNALTVADTDWHLERLYAFARDELGASMIVPRHSRYCIDLNRPPENTPMYPGTNNTELCPTRDFTGAPLYLEGQQPDDAEIARRLQTWWRPYHDALAGELSRIKAEHGHAVLFDGHSIKSELPWLFEGRLPDLNLGTANGASCDAALRSVLADVLAAQTQFTQIVDGRFKGGYITRQYGRPADGVHAVQMEMCWRCYMEESSPFEYDPARAATVLPLLRQLAATMLALPAVLPGVQFERVDPLHPDALALLQEAALEARRLYPDLLDADAPMPTNAPAVPRSVYLLAWRDRRAVACGALRPIDVHCAEVRRMYVLDSERRGGLARTMLAQLELAAIGMGFTHLRLETGNRQLPAMALYEACGFRRIPAFGISVGDPTSVCFEKRLGREVDR